MPKALINVNTCKRLSEVKKNILPFLWFCHENTAFDFVLSLDGNDETYRDFCKQYSIPLIYSIEREGVGLSKNRVLKQFPNYEYYFFIDDDMELLNSEIFAYFISIHQKLHYHHLSYSVNDNLQIIDNEYYQLHGGFRGGGCFNFYSKEALKLIGGWHTHFAKYKRFGHTEHSYRVFYKDLNPYPYIAIQNISDYLILNDPPHVTNISIEQNQNELIPEEQAMIDSEQTYFPVTTLSDFYFNGFDVSIPHLHPDLQKGRYALLKGRDKIRAWGSFYFHTFKVTKNPFYLAVGLLLYPSNNLLKHWVKQIIKK